MLETHVASWGATGEAGEGARARARTVRWHQGKAFAVTFLAYMCVHLVRKPASVLKSELHPLHAYNASTNPGWAPFNEDLDPVHVAKAGLKASGLMAAEGNGKYECTQLDPRSHCRVFANGKAWAIMRENSRLCAALVPSANYEGEFCWVIRRPGQVLPDAVQLYEGLTPQPVAKHDRNEKQWMRLGDDGRWKVDGKIQVLPYATDGRTLLGFLDTFFMLAYTFGMVYAGKVADHVDIGLFLPFGMFFAGVFSCLLGLAQPLGIHGYFYFVIVNIGAGLSQSIAWPCVVAVMGRWFKGHTSKALVLGTWNAHISLGNALGSIIATGAVTFGLHGHDWPLGFVLPGLIIILASGVVWYFIEPDPAAVSVEVSDASLRRALLPLSPSSSSRDESAATPEPTLFRALQIPNVLPFCVCLFFAKMTTNSLLFWGPLYLSNDVGFSSEKAGYLSSFFDLGGCMGGILAGLASDRLRGRHGIVATVFLLASAPMLLVYYSVTHHYGPKSVLNVWMMVLVGLFVNGPVALITTAVSADLGEHETLKNDKRLAASVAGIIDASGSLGSAIQGGLIGAAISDFSWESVWSILALGSLIAATCLIGVVRKEVGAMMMMAERDGALLST